MDKRNFIILALCLFLVYSVRQCSEEKSKKEEIVSIMGAVSDSLSTYINKNGELVNRISTISASSTSLFLDLSFKDTTIQKLQKLVKSYEKELKKGGSAGIVYIEGKTEIITETVVDTITGDYQSSFNLGGWIWGDLSVNETKTLINISSREEVSFVLGKEKTGFLGLGKPKYFSDVKLANPYNTVTSFRTYDTKMPSQDKWVLSAGLNLNYNYTTGKAEVYPGIHFGYKLLSFK